MKKLEVPDVVKELQKIYKKVDTKIAKYGELTNEEIDPRWCRPPPSSLWSLRKQKAQKSHSVYRVWRKSSERCKRGALGPSLSERVKEHGHDNQHADRKKKRGPRSPGGDRAPDGDDPT